MKTLSIRQWMLVGILTFVIIPVHVYTITDLLDRHLFHPQDTGQQSAAVDTALGEIAGGAANWRDPAWQNTLRDRLAALGVSCVIRDPSGTVVFRTGSIGEDRRPAWQGVTTKQAVVMDGEQQRGTVELFTPMRTHRLAITAALFALALAILNAGWKIGNYVVRPLGAMGAAARRIAGGDLDFALPTSRVKEVAAVSAAFQVMGDGLRESIGRQAELEEERRFFVGAIAHDLRTPLFTLRGSLVGMERGLAASPEKAARYIAICRQKADQLDRLVDDLFAYTKAEYLEQTLRRERLELGPLMERIVESLRPRAHDKGVAIIHAEPDDHAAITGDAHLIERAVENLLDNALRYTPPEGTITVTLHVELERVRFTIADTGPGIATQDLPHLFDPLYRAEASRNRETGGVGLGLTIARRILRAHGGDLLAANGASGGAEFTGWLPLPEEAPTAPLPTTTLSETRA